jgi:membrane protease YdiL (CAAX protease family)
MIAYVLKYRKWNKIEMSFAFFLLAVLVSEIAVIFLLGHGSGEALSKTLASIAAMGLSTLDQSWKWIYKMVGPMVFPLVMLTGVEIWAIYKVARCWRKIVNDNPIKQYKVLEIVEGAAPGFGFLGTCISLIFTMSRMDPSLSQSAMLKVLLNNASSAFGSTVFGITLAISAFLVKELFKEFLIKSDANEKSDGQPFEELHEASSMNLIRREA